MHVERRRRRSSRSALGEGNSSQQFSGLSENLRDYWPLSIRQIHYKLLNDPPLKQTPKRSKFDVEYYRYANDKAIVRRTC